MRTQTLRHHLEGDVGLVRLADLPVGQVGVACVLQLGVLVPAVGGNVATAHALTVGLGVPLQSDASLGAVLGIGGDERECGDLAAVGVVQTNHLELTADEQFGDSHQNGVDGCDVCHESSLGKRSP